jgi:signal transduction histidine kinase
MPADRIPTSAVAVKVPQAFTVRRIDLRFADADFEAAFLADYRRRYLGHWRRCHLLSILYFGVYVSLFSMMVPAAKTTALMIGFGIVTPMFLLGLGLSYTRFYAEGWQAINAGYVVVTGIGALVLAVLAGREHMFFGLTAFLYCHLFCFAVIRLRFIPATLAGGAITGAFLFVARDILGDEIVALSLGVFFVAGFFSLGMFIAYGLELSTRRDYHLRMLVEQERGRVMAINEELEQRVRQRTKVLARRNESLREEIDRRRRAERERGELEARFLQAQRMESVGRLAGGVAHDFNNLLTVINSYAELAAAHLTDGDPLKKNIDEIEKAGARAAGLTRQLLAFSRKQVLAPVVLDLNEIVTSLEQMLQRIIGEDIDLRTKLAPGIVRVNADQGQIEQVLMNLAVNARDAMPSGGRLLIETDRVELDDEFVDSYPGSTVGPNVVLTVSDSGVGIAADVRQQIFEPFFTTKEKGSGTGLGLATVYGIVRQSGGSIWVDSAPGCGTTFRIYLPTVSAEGDDDRGGDRPTDGGGDETVLVVEDEPAVREVTCEMLEQAGYRVVAAADGVTALRLAEDRANQIDLLLTDVIMPSLSGPRLAERVCAVRPGLKVLFMSGYTDDAIARYEILDPGANLISKPFSTQTLLHRVRLALDGPPSG